MARGIIITGDFTEAEFAALVAALRRLDDARPTARFGITRFDTAATSLELAEVLLREAVPEQPHRRTDWATLKRN